MARLRATAPAERSILYGREHDGMLTRIGGRSRAHQPNLKKRANRQLKKRDHADVIGTSWSEVTIAWDDGEANSVSHNDMAQVERVP